MPQTRPAAVAGSFYPREPSVLADALAHHLRKASIATAGSPCPKMLVVPHAGYLYSGDMAAQAYRRLEPFRTQIHRVVLLGPVHRVPVRGLAAPTVEAFATPLGRIRLDQTALARLADLPQVVSNDLAHAQEHSLEVQLPFLQAVLGEGFTLVPLAVGDATPADVSAVLERLWGGPETVIVISTDLSHYLHPEEARQRDAATMQRIGRFASDLQGQEACGAHALNGALICARSHGLLPQSLGMCNSGDTGGRDHDRVVGYGAFAFVPMAAVGTSTPGSTPAEASTRAESACPPNARADTAPDNPPSSTPADAALGRAALTLARASMAEVLDLPVPTVPDHPALSRHGACFVTLHDARGQLRGCIGQLKARRALADDIRENARAAAFSDPRFFPLRRDEWSGLAVEVSILSPLEPLPSAATLAEAAVLIKPDTDGVALQWQGHRATFLPQVWKQLPTADQFLRQLLAKAGLALDFWSSDVQLWRYRVTVFEEPRDERPH